MAVAAARANARRVAPSVTVHAADVRVLVRRPVPAPLDALLGRADLVTANPPYVTEQEWAACPPEVRDHDPYDALVAGPDPMAALALAVQAAAALLRTGGLLAVEHGADQAAAVLGLLAGWEGARSGPDLAGRPRVVTARRGPR